MGLAAAGLAAALCVWVFIDAFTNRTTPRGWASLIVVVLFMGSVQLISLGIMGEYIRLIFLESKRRPAYIVDEYRVGSVPVKGHSAAVEESETMDQEEILP
jgi:dolichol-phosphate mannosyltransferase